jgi:hypothetical protein
MIIHPLRLIPISIAVLWSFSVGLTGLILSLRAYKFISGVFEMDKANSFDYEEIFYTVNSESPINHLLFRLAWYFYRK